MTDGHDDLDLLAYAEGRLNGDQAARVEARLRDDPDLARRVQDFADQDRELHARFDRYAEEPLPPRLAALFETPDRAARQGRGHAAAIARAAAVLALMAATGATGWWIGRGGPLPGAAERPFVQAAVERYTAADPATATTRTNARAGNTAVPELSDTTPTRLPPPDLSAQGYRLRTRTPVKLNGDKGLMLDYTNPSGTVVRVFVQRRRDAAEPTIHHRRQGDVTVAYWDDGRLSVAVASRQPDAPVGSLARRVRQTLRKRGTGPAPRDSRPTLATPTQQVSTSPAGPNDQP